jgi:predicted nuclease with TOPRIM domain
MMGNASSALQADIARLDSKVASVRKQLEERLEDDISQADRVALSGAVEEQLTLEEQIMKKNGLPLTPVHKKEHRKLLNSILALESSWTSGRISAEIYIKAIRYKMDFHDHYFDSPQKALLISTAGRQS